MKLSMHTRFGPFTLLEIRLYLKLKLAQLARAWDFAPLAIRVPRESMFTTSSLPVVTQNYACHCGADPSTIAK